MNINDNEHQDAADTDRIPTDRRPLGFWLRAVDTLISREFAEALGAEGVSRREWMLLNALAGEVDVPGLAERLAHRGKRLSSLADRGWIAETDDGWTLTDEGRAARQRLAGLVDGIRQKVAGAVSPEDYDTMVASLQAIATELGGDDLQALREWRKQGFGPGRGFGPGFGGFGRGFGPGFGRGFGPGLGGFGPGARPGFGPGARFGHGPDADTDACRHPHHSGHHRGSDRGERGRKGERAYERGFEAGFTAGQRGTAAAANPADSVA